jgi:flagellar protein FliO/FliZ
MRRVAPALALALLALPAQALAVTSGQLGNLGPAGPDAAPQVDSSAGSVVRVFLGLFLVVVIIGVLYRVLRRAQRGRLPGGRSDGTIEVLETTQLGPGRNIHLVRVGERVLVVGATEHAISPLHAFAREEAIAEGVIAAEHDAPVHVRREHRSLVDALREITSRA